MRKGSKRYHQRIFALASIFTVATAQPVRAEDIAHTSKSGKTASTHSEWLAVQKNALGVHHVSWTDNSVRIDCKNNGYVVVSHGPDWQLYGFRDDDKVCTVLTMREFLSKYPPTFVARNMSKLAGRQLDSFKLSQYRLGMPNNTVLDVVFLDSPKMPPKVAEILLAYYREGLPSNGLLYAVHMDASRAPVPKIESWTNGFMSDVKSSHNVLVTESVKQVPYRALDFECPKGYTQKTIDDVFISKAQKEKLTGIFEDLDIGTGLGEKKSH